jgi:histidine ammonia-lyase
MPKRKTLVLDGKSLNLKKIYGFANAPSDAVEVSVGKAALNAVKKSHGYVSEIAAKTAPVYGINTGFGLLSDVKIPKQRLAELQVNLLRSHACGVGAPLSAPEVRAALLLRLNTIVKGNSGVSEELVKKLAEVINSPLIPWIPEQGSVGASGDLAPLAHMALVLIGEGKAYLDGRLISGKSALEKAKIKPIKLKPKEGLALINGTQIMTAIGALSVFEAIRLAKIADIAGALSLEAIRGTSVAFDPKIHRARPHAEQIQVAENMRRLLANSAIGKSHADCGRVQDPYSFRCIPQVHGAARRLIQNCIPVLETEANSATDNPLVFGRGEILSGGNFHGEYVAMALDTLAIALSEIANISDLRMQKLVNPAMSGLPAFLTPDPGVNSGMMIVQVSAASLVSENKILSHPASVDSIPTSADKEDHVSMGVTAARKARQILTNSTRVLAMELLCGAQGIDFLKPLKPGRGVRAAYECIRAHVSFAGRDRAFHEDIEIIEQLIRSGTLLSAVEHELGEMN